MTRRPLAALAAGVLLAALAGCAMPMPFPPSMPQGELVVPAVDDCLDGMNGLDADWRAKVPCTDDHLYDVVAIGEWPGMADAVAAGGARSVFRAITGSAGDGSEPYWDWAIGFCSGAVREAIGWDSLDARFARLHVQPVGQWAFDMSLATDADFVAGEHRTLCSVGWYEEHARRAGTAFVDDFFGDTTPQTEECWTVDDADATPVSCAKDHTDQAVLWFDARAAFGDAYLLGPDDFDENRWNRANEVCFELVSRVLPGLSAELGVWAWMRYPEQWSDLADAGPEPGTWYLMDCLVGRYDGGPSRGDLLTS